MNLEEIKARRARAKASARRRRIATAVVTGVVVVTVLAGAYVLLRPRPVTPHGAFPTAPASSVAASPSPEPSTWTKTTLSPAPTHSPTATPSPTHTTSAAPRRPPIVADYISFGAKRQAEMRSYSLRHYGQDTLTLKPKVIVLHYTAGGTARSTHALFASDTPNVGELPGVVAHFIVDQDGTIYQELPLDIRGRHAIGLNQVAIGIEFVQAGGSGASWADQQILRRRKQFDAGLRLVNWLQHKYGIPNAEVIGHAMANDDHYFYDKKGWRNDHTDWLPADIDVFREHLKELRSGG